MNLLLQQKQEYLKTAIDKAKESLENQRQLLAQMPTDSTGKMSEEQKNLVSDIILCFDGMEEH